MLAPLAALIMLVALAAPAPKEPAREAPVVSAPLALAEAPAAGANLSKCTSCHAPLTANRKTHLPLKDGDCSACHVANPGPAGKCKSPVSTSWKLAAEQPALCAKCHDVKAVTPLHPVIKLQGCTACHDPHASKNPSLTKIWPADALCYKCHAKFDDAEFVHTAVKQGKCLGCHSPHSGEAAPLLIEQREQLCFSCHKKEQILKGDVVHPPVAAGKCLDCHDPHRSDSKAQTVEAGKALCLKCHDAAKKPARNPPAKTLDLTRKVVHNPVKNGDCTDCHQHHASDNAKLLKAPPPTLCFKCHARNDDEKFVHGAAKVGDCVVCHQPHSSPNQTLLTEATTSALCFRCHEDDITGRAFIHQPVREGKCLDCHEPHSAENRFNLKTGTGVAACTGCHKGKGEVKVKHQALLLLGCTACHDPHGGPNAFQLIKPVNQLCQTCHTDKLDGMHASSFVAGGHMISGDWDPRRKDKSFSCVSCHDAHGSDNPRFFYFGSDGFEMCDACHGDRTGKNPQLKDIHRKPAKPKDAPVPIALAPEVIQ